MCLLCCQGKELRLKQQHFFMSATLQDVVRRYKDQHKDFSQFADKVRRCSLAHHWQLPLTCALPCALLSGIPMADRHHTARVVLSSRVLFPRSVSQFLESHW